MPGAARRQDLGLRRLGYRGESIEMTGDPLDLGHDVAQCQRAGRNLAAQCRLGRPRECNRVCDRRLARQARGKPRRRPRRFAAHQGQRALVRVAQSRLQPHDGLAADAKTQMRRRLDAAANRTQRELVEVRWEQELRRLGPSGRPGMQRQWRADRPVPMIEPRPLIGAADRRMPPEIAHHPLEPHGGRTGGRQGRIAAILDLGRNQQRRGAVAQQGIDLARVRPQRQQRRRRLARHARPLVAGQRPARLHRGAHPRSRRAEPRDNLARHRERQQHDERELQPDRRRGEPVGRNAGGSTLQQCPDGEQHAHGERHQQPCGNGDGGLGEQIQRV